MRHCCQEPPIDIAKCDARKCYFAASRLKIAVQNVADPMGHHHRAQTRTEDKETEIGLFKKLAQTIKCHLTIIISTNGRKKQRSNRGFQQWPVPQSIE